MRSQTTAIPQSHLNVKPGVSFADSLKGNTGVNAKAVKFEK